MFILRHNDDTMDGTITNSYLAIRRPTIRRDNSADTAVGPSTSANDNIDPDNAAIEKELIDAHLDKYLQQTIYRSSVDNVYEEYGLFEKHMFRKDVMEDDQHFNPYHNPYQ